MHEYVSIYYKQKKNLWWSFLVYAIIALIITASFIYGAYMDRVTLSSVAILLPWWYMFVVLAWGALYGIFQIIYVDETNRIISQRLLNKPFHFDEIVSLEKNNADQLIIKTKDSTLAVTLCEEEEFVALLQQYNPSLVVVEVKESESTDSSKDEQSADQQKES